MYEYSATLSSDCTSGCVTAWIVAAWWLPMWVVLMALAVWIAKVYPAIRAIHAGFQNVPHGVEPA